MQRKVREFVRMAVDQAHVFRPVPDPGPVLQRDMVPDRDQRVERAVLPVQLRDRILAAPGKVAGRRSGSPGGRVGRDRSTPLPVRQGPPREKTASRAGQV